MKDKSVCVFLVCLIWSPLLPREKRHPHPELCELKTAFISGNSESATKVRQELEKRTWLRLVGSADKADATLDVSETRSEKNFPIRTEQTTVSATLTRNSTKEVVWSGSASFGEGVVNSGAGSAVKIVLGHLSREAGCKE
jgi:hypothetical protein